MIRIPSGAIRLYQTQEVLAEQLDLPLRLLRRNAFESVIDLVSVKVREELGRLSESPIYNEPIAEEISSVVLSALAPNKAESERAISQALWMTPISAQNPFFGDLQAKFPRIKALSRLNHLRIIRNPNDVQRVRQLSWTESFLERFEPIALPGYTKSSKTLLVVGPIWSRAASPTGREASKTLFADLEQQVSGLLSQLAAINAEPLINQQREGLMAQVSAFVNFDQGFLDSKIRLIVTAIEQALALFDSQPDVASRLSSVEWGRAVQWIAFWRSRRFSHLLDDQVIQPLMEHIGIAPKLPVTFSLRTSLVGAWKEQRHSIELLVSHSPPSQSTTHFLLAEGASPGDPGNISFNSLDSTLTPSRDHIQNIHFSYLRFLEERRAARGRQDYLAFDRLRGALQELPFADSVGRGKLIVRRARRLVMADYAALFSYDSLADSLRLDSHRAPPWAPKPNGKALRELLVAAAKDPAQRAESVIFRCLDLKKMQTSFEPVLNSGMQGAEELQGDAIVWGFPAADFLSTPIAFHGRMLGVLYLATAEPNRFRYADRNRLITFVRSFEAELFEARLLSCLQRINNALGRALRRDLTPGEQQAFINETLREIGSLLAVRGLTLWWRSNRSPGSLQLMGLMGSDMPATLCLGTESSIFDEPFARLREGFGPLSIERQGTKDLPALASARLPYLTLIPLQEQNTDDLVGFITLHDSEPINLTQALTDELLFLSQEIGQNLSEYMASRDRDQTNRELIGHEVGTALRSIDSVRVRLEGLFVSSLSSRDIRAVRMLGDIAAHIDTARELLDYLTSEPLQNQVRASHENPVMSFYHYLNLQPQARPVPIRSIINDTFQPRIDDLRNRKISLRQTSSIIPPLWVRASALRQVFANMVDNIVKYGEGGRPVLLNDGVDSLEYFVTIESAGCSLRKELLDSPEKIFERGLRGASHAITTAQEGQGNGLYIAYMLARSWGGTIRLLYTPGQLSAGYKFSITFPLWLGQRENPWKS